MTSSRDATLPTLWLIPSTMSDADPRQVLPDYNFRVMDSLRHFLVENVRTARRFLKHCNRSINIDSLSLTELSEHTSPQELPSLMKPMEQGYDMGIISEAGCPAVADPGSDAVAYAQSRGWRVTPLVGPSSILMALMGSGFNGQSFAFTGYLPIDATKRTAAIKEMTRRILREHQTQIFIETPYRNNRLLAELIKLLPPDFKLCVASDITGSAQHIVTRSVAQWASAEYDYAKIPAIFLLYQ